MTSFAVFVFKKLIKTIIAKISLSFPPHPVLDVLDYLYNIAITLIKFYWLHFIQRFDFIVTVAAIAGLMSEELDQNFYYIVILRPLRLLR